MAAACCYSNSTHLTTAHRPWRVQRPPRAPPIRRSVAPWEKEFCESGGVPWWKVKDPDVGINADAEGIVSRWDDSAAVQALLAAKKRYWADINGGIRPRGAAALSLDPDLYIDVMVEDGGVDPELDAEYEAALRAMDDAWDENVKLQAAKLRVDDFVPVATGWKVDS